MINRIIKLNTSEKEILNYMIKSPGKIFSRDDIGKITNLSKEITMFHQKGIGQIVGYGGSRPIDIIGFHGITLWHKPADQYTHQIGDAQLLKKKKSNIKT